MAKLLWKGNTIQGVYVPDDGKPLPVGVLRASNYSSASVQKKQQVDTGYQQWRDNQASDTHRSLVAKALSTAGPTVKATEEVMKRDGQMEAVPASTDSEPETKPNNKGQKRKSKDAELDDNDEDEDSNDFTDLLFGARSPAASKDKSKASPAGSKDKKPGPKNRSGKKGQPIDKKPGKGSPTRKVASNKNTCSRWCISEEVESRHVVKFSEVHRQRCARLAATPQ